MGKKIVFRLFKLHCRHNLFLCFCYTQNRFHTPFFMQNWLSFIYQCLLLKLNSDSFSLIWMCQLYIHCYIKHLVSSIILVHLNKSFEIYAVTMKYSPTTCLSTENHKNTTLFKFLFNNLSSLQANYFLFNILSQVKQD